MSNDVLSTLPHAFADVDTMQEQIEAYTTVEGGPWISVEQDRAVYFRHRPIDLTPTIFSAIRNALGVFSFHSIRTVSGKTWDAYVGWRAPIESAEPVTTEQVVEGTKLDQDKPRMDLMSSYAVEQLAKVLTFGAEVKYADHNWRKGIKLSRLLASCLRHVFKFLSGEDTDPETGLSHMAHAMCCCMFIIELYHTKPELDDRYKIQGTKS